MWRKRIIATILLLLLTGIGCGGGGAPTNYVSNKAVGVSAGADFSSALKDDNTILSWGANYRGQIGDNTLIDRSSPVLVTGYAGNPTLTDIINISCGSTHSLALKKDGTLWAWGDISFNTNPTNNIYPVPGVGGIGYLDNIVAISARWHSLSLNKNGTLTAWGSNAGGQLGDGTGINRYVPVPVNGPGGLGVLAGIKKIAAGNIHTLALGTDNTIWAWGSNDSGQLGDNTYNTRFTPSQVYDGQGTGILSGGIDVAAGDRHSLVLDHSGNVWAWGMNSLGQLGDNTKINKYLPILVKDASGIGPLNNVAAISCGLWHSIALKKDGTVWAWGYNHDGQLGINSILDSPLPVQVLGENGHGILSGVVAVSAGWKHSLALKADGSVWAWGLNDHGQLGDGANVNSLLPKRVNGF